MFSLIGRLAFAPVPGAEDSDDVFTIREAHRHHATIDPTETVVSRFVCAVGDILCDHAVRVAERELGFRE
jgi:hypothetical protein